MEAEPYNPATYPDLLAEARERWKDTMPTDDELGMARFGLAQASAKGL
jgi:hypothetical protein